MDNTLPLIYPGYPPAQLDQLDPESPEDVTEPEWEKGPFKSNDGYNGKSKHFNVRLNVIKIKNTDAVAGNMPSEEQREFRVDEEQKFSQHEGQKMGDDVFQLWMSKIGPYLADWVLHLPRHENPPWRLLKFPDGYTLWVHKTGVMSDRGNPRTDAYLYGAPHLGPSTARAQSNSTLFRSPMEFVPHAIWLMRGKTGQCECKYCIPGQNQKVINRRLNHGVDADSDRESGDEDDNNAASRRNQGANAGAGRTRRKRDRSPPINIDIARDYRVQGTDPGPSSAT